MPSEYDFLLPYSRYSRSLRPAGRGRKAFLLTATFAAGVVSTALIVGLPLRPFSPDKNLTTTAQKQAPRPSESLTPNPPADTKVATNSAADNKVAANTAGDSKATAPAKPAPGNVAQRPRETTGAASPAPKPEPAPAAGAAPTAGGAAPPRTAATTDAAPTRSAPAPAGDAASTRTAQTEVDTPSIIAANEPVPQPRPRPLALNREPAPAEPAANAAVPAVPVPTPAPVEKPAATPAPVPESATSEGPDAKPHKPVVPRTERAIAARTEPAEKPAVRSEAPVPAPGARPAAAEKPAVAEKSVAAEKPAVVEKPAAAEKPAASDAAVVSRETGEAARSEGVQSRNGKRTVERQRAGSGRSYASRQDRQDQRQRKVARSRDDDDGREFVDSHGVRHIILSSRDRARVAADIGRDRMFESGWRPRRFFIFGPPDDED